MYLDNQISRETKCLKLLLTKDLSHFINGCLSQTCFVLDLLFLYFSCEALPIRTINEVRQKQNPRSLAETSKDSIAKFKILCPWLLTKLVLVVKWCIKSPFSFDLRSRQSRIIFNLNFLWMVEKSKNV